MPGEFPTREAIRSQQLERLRALLGAILPDNKFYQRKLAGLNPAISSLEDFSARFPFTTKQELVEDQKAFPPFGTNLTFPLVQYTRYHQTSGTTSAPLRWLDTPESWSWMVQSWKRIFEAAGVGAGNRVYFPFSFGPFIGFWLAFAAAEKLGCLCIPGGGLGSPGRVRAIIDNGVTALCCTPSYAVHLAEVAVQEKVDLRAGPVRTLIVAGEPGGSIPATRARLEKLWPGARFFDHHGMTETGPVTYECPVRPGVLHVMEEAYLAEVMEGELVLTTLGRAGSPLLRYRTGDMVRAEKSQLCACGRHDLALAGGILGRTDEMLIVRGVNIYPTAVEDVLRGFVEIAEYQVQVDKSQSLAELTLLVEPKPGCADTSALVERVQAKLHTVFNLRVPVVLAAAGSLPRFEMKAKRWTVENSKFQIPNSKEIPNSKSQS